MVFACSLHTWMASVSPQLLGQRDSDLGCGEAAEKIRTIYVETKGFHYPGWAPEIVPQLAISPDGQRIALGPDPKRGTKYNSGDVATGRLGAPRLRGAIRDRTLGELAFHLGGPSARFGGAGNGTVRDLGAERNGSTDPPVSRPPGLRHPPGCLTAPMGTAESASAFTDGTVRIWNPDDGERS